MNLPDDRPLVMLDSGAYSAWTKADSIDLDKYAQFVKDNSDVLDVPVNVDVIPGSYGRRASKEEVDASAEKGWENFLYLRSKGVETVHVYHQGEDVKWLRQLAEASDYIGLSPAEDRSPVERMLWLDSLMPILTDKDGFPKQKWHGFGVTAFEMLFRYPWYSVDSATWVKQGFYGRVFVPNLRYHGVERFTKRYLLRISDSPRKIQEQYYDGLSPQEKAVVNEWFARVGADLELLRTYHMERCRVNAAFFAEMETMPTPPWVPPKKGMIF